MSPIKLVSSDQSWIRIDDLFDRNIEILNIRIDEYMGGEVTTIELKGQSEEIPCKVDEEFTGTLYSGEHKVAWNFKCFVYTLDFHNHQLNIKFACCLPKFLKDNVVTKYTSIDNAIQSTWQLTRLDSVSSGLSFDADHPLHQQNESNYNYCKRLCFAYKYDTIFGFLINGLKFVDLKNWQKELELKDKVDISLDAGSSFSEPKLYNKSVEFIDYNHDSPEFESDPNHVLVSMNGHVIPVDTAYKDLIGNHEHNRRLLDPKHSTPFHMDYLHGMDVGTNVEVKSNQLYYKKSVITERHIEMSKAYCKVDYKLQSIEI